MLFFSFVQAGKENRQHFVIRESLQKQNIWLNFTWFHVSKNTPLNYAQDSMQINIDQVELILFLLWLSIVCVFIPISNGIV